MGFYRFIYIIFLCFGLALTGCQGLSDIKSQLEDHENRLNSLETICKQANQDLAALGAIVQAIEESDRITAIKPLEEGNKVIGYIISFSKKGDIKILNGKNGLDGKTPYMGVKKDSDGNWYWTLNGDWLIDSNGNKVPASGVDGKPGVDGAPGQDGKPGADGITPKLKIVDGYWYVSYDNGLSWESEPLGPAEGQPSKPIFSDLTYDADFVYITLADGVTKLKIPRALEAQEQLSATIALERVTINSASFKGHLNAPASDLRYSIVTMYYSESADFNIHTANSVSATTFDGGQNFTIVLNNLKSGTKYYYCIIAKVKSSEYYGDVASFQTSAPGWTAGTYFSAGVSEHSGWYDVNKRKDSFGGWNGSFLHCWAITASNMVQWWQDTYKAAGNILPVGAPDGPGSLFELAVYEKMKDAFQDASGSTQVGVHWYFTGEDREASMQGGNHPKPYTGGFFKDSFGPIMEAMGGESYLVNINGYDVWGNGKTDPRRTLVIVSEYLRNAVKDGIVGLTIRAGRSLLHEVTLWGVDLDHDGNLTHIWITDSDDQMKLHYSKPRTPALHHLRVEERGNAVAILGYYNGDTPEIMAITSLKACPAAR